MDHKLLVNVLWSHFVMLLKLDLMFNILLLKWILVTHMSHYVTLLELNLDLQLTDFKMCFSHTLSCDKSATWSHFIAQLWCEIKWPQWSKVFYSSLKLVLCIRTKCDQIQIKSSILKLCFAFYGWFGNSKCFQWMKESH